MRLSSISIAVRQVARRLVHGFLENAPRSGCVEWATDDGRRGQNFFAGLNREEVDEFTCHVCALTPCAPVDGQVATVTYRVRFWFDLSLRARKKHFWD